MSLIYSLNKQYQKESYRRLSDDLIIEFIKNYPELTFNSSTKNKMLSYVSEQLQNQYQDQLKKNKLKEIFLSKNLFENYDILDKNFYDLFGFIERSKKTYQEVIDFIDLFDEHVVLTDLIILTDTEKPESVFNYYKFVGMNWNDNELSLYSNKLKSTIFVGESVTGAFISKIDNFDFINNGGFTSEMNQIRGNNLINLFNDYDVVLR